MAPDVGHAVGDLCRQQALDRRQHGHGEAGGEEVADLGERGVGQGRQRQRTRQRADAGDVHRRGLGQHRGGDDRQQRHRERAANPRHDDHHGDDEQRHRHRLALTVGEEVADRAHRDGGGVVALRLRHAQRGRDSKHATEPRTTTSTSPIAQVHGPMSYRNAFDFSHPRNHSKFGVVDDGYLCALKKPSESGPKVVATKDVSWGRGICINIASARIRKKVRHDLYNTSHIAFSRIFRRTEDGYMLNSQNKVIIMSNVARITPVAKKICCTNTEKLATKENLFATTSNSRQTSGHQGGNFDPLFLEAADFDDGFANIVHCAQPQKANLILEPNQEGLPPVKDFGIRIGWEDEQILDWHNRLLRRPDYLSSGTPPTPGDEIVDAPSWNIIVPYRCAEMPISQDVNGIH